MVANPEDRFSHDGLNEPLMKSFPFLLSKWKMAAIIKRDVYHPEMNWLRGRFTGIIPIIYYWKVTKDLSHADTIRKYVEGIHGVKYCSDLLLNKFYILWSGWSEWDLSVPKRRAVTITVTRGTICIFDISRVNFTILLVEKMSPYEIFIVTCKIVRNLYS